MNDYINKVHSKNTIRIDVIAYNRKRCMMPSDCWSDKGLPTKSEQVLLVPLSRKLFRVLVSSLGRDWSPVYILTSKLERKKGSMCKRGSSRKDKL